MEGLIAKCMLVKAEPPGTGKYPALATAGPWYPRLEGGVVPGLDGGTALGREILPWPAQPSTVPPSDVYTPSGCLPLAGLRVRMSTLSPTKVSKGPSVSRGTVVTT